MVQIAIHLHSTSSIQFITEFGGLQYFTILSKKGNNNNFQNMYLFLICPTFLIKKHVAIFLLSSFQYFNFLIKKWKKRYLYYCKRPSYHHCYWLSSYMLHWTFWNVVYITLIHVEFYFSSLIILLIFLWLF